MRGSHMRGDIRTSLLDIISTLIEFIQGHK